MSECLRTPADRQFRRRCQITGSVSLVLYVVCSQLALRLPNGPFCLTLAGIGGAAFFVELVSVAFLVTRMNDEFQRILLTRSFVWAAVITMAFVTVWGFIELRGHGTIPHLPTIVVPAILIVLTTAAKLIIFRQHKSPQG